MQAPELDYVRVIVSIDRREFDATVAHLERYGLQIQRRMAAVSAVSGMIGRRKVKMLPKVPGVIAVQRGSGSGNGGRRD
jgi:hypothetical protein